MAMALRWQRLGKWGEAEAVINTASGYKNRQTHDELSRLSPLFRHSILLQLLQLLQRLLLICRSGGGGGGGSSSSSGGFSSSGGGGVNAFVIVVAISATPVVGKP